MLGGTLVPLPIPLRVRDRAAVAAHLDAFVGGFECAHIAAHERYASLLPAELVIPWDDYGSAGALNEADMVEADRDSLALITPTSGSTSAPKGVGETYRGVSHTSMGSLMNPFGYPTIRYLTYAPLAHAAGSVALYTPVEPWLEAHMLSPERFARDPAELFRVVGREKIITAAATSSAVAAALRAIERRPEGVDLSSLEWFTFAFEMVDPDVVEHLIDLGAKFGLRRGAVASYYGMSEGGGTVTPPGGSLRIEELDLDALVTQGVARPAAKGAPVKRVVACGVAQMDLRIAGSDGPLPERHVGEVQFRYEYLMSGYIGPGAEEAFDDDGWMHTGDVGFLAEGELFLTGRIKEVMVQQGKKYHPEDIEWAAARGAEVAPAECVAFTSIDADEGDIIVAIETPLSDGLAEVEQRVRAAVVNAVGIRLREVVFVRPATLPKASSGKAQRLAARDKHARGELEVVLE
jgi:acyl-CoA synthetase (AMP-forming)/AMP-acid ligase II